MHTVTQFRYHTETINGVEIEKPAPKRLHAIIQARIQRMLETQLDGRPFELLPSLDMLCGVDRYVPDLTVARTRAQYTNDMLAEGALLTVEIMSPGQTLGRLFDKCEVYVQHGTLVCWVIWPKRRQAWLYTRSALTEVHQHSGHYLEASTASLSLRVSLQDLFAELPESTVE